MVIGSAWPSEPGVTVSTTVETAATSGIVVSTHCIYIIVPVHEDTSGLDFSLTL